MRHVSSSRRDVRATIGVAVLLVTLVFSSGVASASSSGRALLKTALHHATSAGWVHETVQVKRKSVVVQDSLDYIGATEGQQYVSGLGGATSELIAFDQRHMLYVRANSAGLSTLYSLSSTDAATYANEWLLLTPSDADYSSIAYATTLVSDFGQVRFAGAVTESGVITYAGRRVRALSGVVPAFDGAPKFGGTLYVTASGKVLPVTFVERDAKASITVSWADWGHRYVLRAPANPVDFPTS
ncbi:MAG: hypothetical protein WAK12_05655 [Acidimicrobiales bacterium]